MAILEIVGTLAVIGAFAYIATQWSKGGDGDNNCGS